MKLTVLHIQYRDNTHEGMKVPKGNRVSYTTFFKWNTIINTQVVDGAVVKVWCTTCAKHADKIIRDARGTSIAPLLLLLFYYYTKFKAGLNKP